MSERHRGTGRVFRPRYRNARGEWKQASTWSIAYNVRGREYREPSHSARRTDAVRLLKQRLGEMRIPEHPERRFRSILNIDSEGS